MGLYMHEKCIFFLPAQCGVPAFLIQYTILCLNILGQQIHTNAQNSLSLCGTEMKQKYSERTNLVIY